MYAYMPIPVSLLIYTYKINENWFQFGLIALHSIESSMKPVKSEIIYTTNSI